MSGFDAGIMMLVMYADLASGRDDSAPIVMFIVPPMMFLRDLFGGVIGNWISVRWMRRNVKSRPKAEDGAQ